MSKIYVFHSFIEELLYDISDNEVKKVLNSVDLNKYQIFINDKSRSQFLAGRLLLFKGLTKLHSSSLLKNIDYSTSGKPFIKGVNFNISHSENLIGLIITKSDLKVGIDIEEIVEKVNYTDIANSLQSPILNASINLDDFINRWTIVESIIKASDKSLDEIESINQNNNGFYDFDSYNFRVESIKVDNYWLSFAIELKGEDNLTIIKDVIKK
ncbi:hypothetical protein OO013_06685 [Mangrovivirga sp. M17]|uniref:4'-phosphopantetheinyl transferase superfamily protein n=1 Tax=Mangrovivirga halotolerans TaxID=2993936 RepID=A0ABT3RP22_9BACT|nr:hypothetical protein [Mangrovivirga halotolerans]MCX2743543.1 hypothetical protein [Mangrovivirga halotolerans]